ncbi:hypothetical protein SUGI_0406100 [Cryptomeria japonica]|uniref:protein ELF4-LIKE 3 n=1 Tax=Cryptomeria japonica TaxID=3369 RepID=UPI0024089ADA|nr:protein ELF4-LIKE 3 [Cryptomeria japonica]GLJ21761.1 hypothetical protein SUGI_0406100 [Cryptomeria japonica]
MSMLGPHDQRIEIPFISFPDLFKLNCYAKKYQSPLNLFSCFLVLGSQSSSCFRLFFIQRFDMEMNGSFGTRNVTQTDDKVWQNFQKSFSEVQNILDQNRQLINEINQNQESMIPDNLSRSAVMIRDLNNNIGKVAALYSDLSTTFVKEIKTSSQGDSAGISSCDRNSAQKRTRPA